MKTPNSWKDIFDVVRQTSLNKMPQFEATRHYVEQLERAIFTIRKPGDEMPAIETLLFGVLLGDVVVRRFGGWWHYGEFTPGTITNGQISAHVVRLDNRQGVFCRQAHDPRRQVRP
jgi:hypothetical protein